MIYRDYIRNIFPYFLLGMSKSNEESPRSSHVPSEAAQVFGSYSVPQTLNPKPVSWCEV